MVKLAALAIALTATSLGTSNAHLIMKTPVPFGVSTLNNSPLVNIAPGTATSDYPCKLRAGVYDITAMNNMKVGDTQELSFIGSASHGGGTCQLVYTTDLEPSANTTFKLFQTFEGACPVQADGNAGTHPFTFVLPEGTPNGRLTMAWIWYNRIGDREIYMNCAPLDVTGGSDKLDFYNSLPNAYIINLPTTDCASFDNVDAKIPFPGQYVMSNTFTSIAAATGPSCAKSAAAMTEGVSDYKSAIVTNAAAYSAPATNQDVTGSATGGSQVAGAASAAGTSAGTSLARSSGFASVSTGSAASSTFPTLNPSSAAGVAQSTGTAAASGTTGASGSSSGTCSSANDGAIMCNGPTQFGLCNNGNVVWQQVAPGTTCSNGNIMKRGTVLRHPHVRKHVNAGSHI